MWLKEGGLIACIPILAAVILALACPQGVVVAQDVAPAVLSERVGNTIDTYERRYFSLFPGVKGFDSAIVSLRNDSLLFRVARYNMPDTVITVDPALTGIFRSYIEDFELLFDTRYPDSREEMQKRGLLVNQCLKLQSAGLVRFRETAQRDVPEVTVVLADSTGIRGRILAFRDSALMIWRTGKAYRWKDLASSLAIVSMKDVKGIIRTGPGSFATGFFAGWWVTFILMSTELSSRVDAHNSADEYMGAGMIIITSFLASTVVGLTSGLVTLVAERGDRFYPGSKPEDYKTLSLFSSNLPPELRRYAGMPLNDMTLPSEPVRKKVLASKQRKYLLPRGMTFRIDYGMNFYYAGSRELGVWVGASVAHDIPVWLLNDRGTVFSFRPRLGLGNKYALVEAAGKISFPNNVYILGGISYQPLSEDFGRYDFDLYDHLEQNDIRQSTFFVAGIGIDLGNSILEVQFRSLWKPAIVTTVPPITYYSPVVPAPRRYNALSFSYGFRF